jgi:hypothetical protein
MDTGIVRNEDELDMLPLLTAAVDGLGMVPGSYALSSLGLFIV